MDACAHSPHMPLTLHWLHHMHVRLWATVDYDLDLSGVSLELDEWLHLIFILRLSRLRDTTQPTHDTSSVVSTQ